MRRRAQPWLGTLVEVTVADGRPESQADAAIDAAFAAIARVHGLMSFHESGSDVSRFNGAAPGAMLQVDPWTWQVLKLAAAIAEASGGAFNVACAPQLVAWRLLPAPLRGRAHFVPGVSVYSCERDGRVRKLAPGWIDLGGIAKGFAVDRAADAMRDAGALSGCINAGGDLRAFGPQDFPVLVRAPQDPAQYCEAIQLRNQAIATSSCLFSRSAAAHGVVSALVDGRDGAPLTEAISVSVRAASCAVADALTKVVLATKDTGHHAVAAFDAHALLHGPCS